jgi:hypothetical protein
MALLALPLAGALQAQENAPLEPPSPLADGELSSEPTAAGASEGAADADAMARKLANPVGSIYSVPIETTFDFGAANGDATFINIQPVIPVTVNERWNLINRTIVPLIDAPGTPLGRLGNPNPQFGSRTFGLGDISHSLFLSPAVPGKVIWGAGPILSFPSATDAVLGSEKWSAGPTVVALTQPKPWTFGALAGNLWSYAGASDRSSINQMFLQYFINYGFPGGWYLTTTPMMTANWRTSSSERWTIPVGGGAGKVFSVGKQAMRAQLQGFYYAEKPTGGPEWALMLTVQFVFPRK